jgi:RimJ/RimL family protein N-acetyltransferase
MIEVKQQAQVLIETERLRLRTWKEADIDPMSHIDSDPEVRKFYDGLRDREYTIGMIKYFNKLFDEFGYTFYAAETKNDSKFIGFVGLNNLKLDIPCLADRPKPHAEIGWRLAADSWGNGYATEAARSIIENAFSNLGICDIVAYTSKQHTASRRIMEKLGMSYNPLDDFRHPDFAPDHWLSEQVLYRISKK